MDASFSTLLKVPLQDLLNRARELTIEHLETIHARLPFHLPPESPSDTKNRTSHYPMDLPAAGRAESLLMDASEQFRQAALSHPDAETYWTLSSRIHIADLPSEAHCRIAAAVWQEITAPNTKCLIQTLPSRISPAHQQKVNQTRQAAWRKQPPITSEALAQQLARFQKTREMRPA